MAKRWRATRDCQVDLKDGVGYYSFIIKGGQHTSVLGSDVVTLLRS